MTKINALDYGDTPGGDAWNLRKLFRTIDAVTQCNVISATTTAQPASPAQGDLYIIPSGKTGALWSTFATGSLAQYRTNEESVATWIEITPQEGWQAWVKDANAPYRYSGTAWFLDNVINVKAFGAVGDGDADDAAALQSAYTYAALMSVDSSRFGRGIEVFHPPGRYKTTAALSLVNGGVTLTGAGRFSSVIVNAGSNINTLLVRGADYLTARKYGGGVRNLGFDYTGSNPSAGAHLRVVGWDHFVARDCFLSGHYRGIELLGTTNFSAPGTHIEGQSNVSVAQTGSAALALHRLQVNSGYANAVQDPADSNWYVNTNSTYLSDGNYRATPNNSFEYIIYVGSCDGLYGANMHLGFADKSIVYVKAEQSNLGPNNIDIHAFYDCYGAEFSPHAIHVDDNSAFTPSINELRFAGKASWSSQELVLIDSDGVTGVTVDLDMSYSGKEAVRVRRGTGITISGRSSTPAHSGGSEGHIHLGSADGAVSQVTIDGGMIFRGGGAEALKTSESVDQLNAGGMSSVRYATLGHTNSSAVINITGRSAQTDAVTAANDLVIRPEHTLLVVSGTTQIQTIKSRATGIESWNKHQIILRLPAGGQVRHSANDIRLSDSRDFTAVAACHLALIYDETDGCWKETGRSENVKCVTQKLTSSATWTKLGGAVRVHVQAMGNGGGGGGGSRIASGSAGSGGGAGGGGMYAEDWFDASVLGSTEAVTIGAQGSSGAGATSDGTAGADGGQGGDNSFGSWLTAFGGGGGAGGEPAANSGGGGAAGVIGAGGSATSTTGGSAGAGGGNVGGAGGAGNAPSGPGAGASGGGGTSGAAGSLGGSVFSAGGCGGGSGGGISAGPTGYAGGNGGRAKGRYTAISGGALGGNPGTTPTLVSPSVGYGGGGGGANASGVGGAGGAGVNGGGAGGGGSGCTGNGGAGGVGGLGYVQVTQYF